MISLIMLLLIAIFVMFCDSKLMKLYFGEVYGIMGLIANILIRYTLKILIVIMSFLSICKAGLSLLVSDISIIFFILYLIINIAFIVSYINRIREDYLGH